MLLAFLVVKPRTDVDGVVWVDGTVVEFHVLDLSFFIDNDGGAPSPFVFIAIHGVFLQDAVLRENFVVHVAEERHGNADLLGEGCVGRGTVDANAEDYGVAGVELGLISLIGL